jgi:hypothetical protein
MVSAKQSNHFDVWDFVSHKKLGPLARPFVQILSLNSVVVSALIRPYP